MRPLHRRVAAIEAAIPDDHLWRQWVGRPVADWPPEALGELIGQWCADKPGTQAAIDCFTDAEVRGLYLEARRLRGIERGLAAGRLTPEAANEIRATVAEVIGPPPPALNHDEFTNWVEARIARVEALFGDEAHVTH